LQYFADTIGLQFQQNKRLASKTPPPEGEGVGTKKMPIAKLTIELEIPHAQSLKDRRQVVRSMKDKLRHSFNLSIAELDDGIVWNRATLGIAAISSSTPYLTGQLQQIDRAVHRFAAALSAEILDSYAEILPE
jgi:uncharacterized protein YlxP (DUF503 family)